MHQDGIVDAVEIRGLVRRFGDTVAVAGVDLTVPQGSFFGLVGPNGAGKSTLLSMATGLVRPTAGTVRVAGHDVWTDPVAAKARSGVLPEGLRLFERLTGRELLGFTGRLRGLPGTDADSRADELLRVLDLAGAGETLVADYSTGMRKKIGLAAALLHNPAVLFLDEPFEAVDPVSARVIRGVLERYTRSGSTVVFSSHAMELVDRLCDTVAVLHRGHVVAAGPIERVRGGRTLEDAFLALVGAAGPGGRGAAVAGLLLRLKLRLLRNALRSPGRAVFLLLGLVFGLAGTAVLGSGLQVLRDDPPVAAAAGMLVAAVLAIGWSTVPIAAFGVDETLDVSRLALLPIRRGRLLAGLLLAATVGVPSLLTFLLLGAAVAAVTTSWAAVPAAVVAAPLLAVLCLLLGRVVTSGLSRLLRSRRGRDLAVLVGVGVVLAAQAPRLLAENLGEGGLLRIGDVLRWTPARGRDRRGRVRERRLLGGGTGRTGVPGRDRRRARPRLVRRARRRPGRGGRLHHPAAAAPYRAAGLLPDDRLGAVAAKELRYGWRDPRLKLSWLQMMIFGAAVPAFSLWDSGRSARWSRRCSARCWRRRSGSTSSARRGPASG
jgi:ABC-2 type transport system ATP-binding protein